MRRNYLSQLGSEMSENIAYRNGTPSNKADYDL